MNLVLKGNSFALEILFAPEDKIIRCNKFAQDLRDNVHKLISRSCYKAFSGFARSEYHKTIGEKTRNLGGKRKRQIKEYGYAAKNAYHCIRILEQGRELFEKGEIILPRPNRNFLLKLKNGESNKKKIKKLFEKKDEQLKEAYENTHLSDKPDYEWINDKICESIYWSLENDPRI